MDLMASILCALAMEHPAQAAVFTIPAGDVAALINAVNAANGNGEEDTIHLAAGTYTLTAVDNDIRLRAKWLASQLLAV